MSAQVDEQSRNDKPDAVSKSADTGRGGATRRSAPVDEPTPWSRVVVLVLGVATLVLVVATAFGWPAVNGGPRDVPVAVVAPPAVAEQVGGALAQGVGEGAFDLQPVEDRAAAETAILDREV